MSLLSFLKRTYDKSCILGQGSTGSKVLQVETRLQQLGYYSGKLDSSYGPMLTASVNKFQKDHGMKQYGCIGNNTWNLLFPIVSVNKKNVAETNIVIDKLPKMIMEAQKHGLIKNKI